jgi:hypothetical protein
MDIIGVVDLNEDEVTLDQCVKLLKAESNIKKLLSSAKERLTNHLLGGGSHPDLKLVHKKVNRIYSNPELAKNQLIRMFSKSEVVEERLKSPSQIELLMESKPKMRGSTKMKIYSLIEKPEGDPVAALKEDSRKEYEQEQLLNSPTGPQNIEDLF